MVAKLCAIILNIPGRISSSNAATSQECVEKVTSHTDVVQGTHRKSSDVVDVVRQPEVVVSSKQQAKMKGEKLSFLSAN